GSSACGPTGPTSRITTSSPAGCGARPRRAGGRTMLLDTDVMVDVLRGHQPALIWFSGVTQSAAALPGLGVTELVQGCQSKPELTRTQLLLVKFQWHWPTPADCLRAYQDFSNYHLSHGLGLLDSLIGATAAVRPSGDRRYWSRLSAANRRADRRDLADRQNTIRRPRCQRQQSSVRRKLPRSKAWMASGRPTLSAFRSARRVLGSAPSHDP